MEDDPAPKLDGLEVDFDNDRAEQLLSLEIGESSISSLDFLAKSFYDFDLETKEGIEKLLTLLPVLDPDIVFQIVHEIWPGYPPENFEVHRFRLEIKGYLLSYLDDQAEA